MSRERFERELEAWRDGELSWLARWRVERRLRRDPEAKRRLAALDAAGRLLREIDADAPAPDVWDAVRLRLPALDARRAEAEAATRRAGLARGLRWSAAGGVAAAAAALALVLRFGGEAAAPEPPPGAVRWLDARGLPMMVLRDDAEATIIWVPEQAPAVRSGATEARHDVV